MGAINDLNDFIIRTGLAQTLIAFGIFFFALVLGATLHEFGHQATAAILGSEVTNTHVQIMTGVTEFETLTNGKHIIIAFAGPLFAYLMGMLMWFASRDGLIRAIGAIIVFFSFIPSFLPNLPGSDMYYAISNGFPLLLGWLLWIFLTGFFGAEFIKEIREKGMFQK